MKHILVRNVEEALCEGFWHLKICGVRENSRNGPVIVAPTPVMTTYRKPMERVLFGSERDANPAFHLMEAIWMLAGANNVEFLLPFNSQFGKYAEADGRVHGAYGHRWRNAFGHDQINTIISMLRENPDTRQAVMQMWDCDSDLGQIKNDLPCNTHIYFYCRGGMLHMTVCCRSNDILWGAYGANAVHMSMLQELIAHAINRQVGVYNQFSNNYHAYADNEMAARFLDYAPLHNLSYDLKAVEPMPLVMQQEESHLTFLKDCEDMITLAPEEEWSTPRTKFFQKVACPIRDMYLCRKFEGETFTRQEITHTAPGNDWLKAFADWCDRRKSNDVLA